MSPGVSKGKSLSVLHCINPIPDGGIVVPNQGDETVMKSLYVVSSHKFLKNSVSLVPSFNKVGGSPCSAANPSSFKVEDEVIKPNIMREQSIYL